MCHFPCEGLLQFKMPTPCGPQSTRPSAQSSGGSSFARLVRYLLRGCCLGNRLEEQTRASTSEATNPQVSERRPAPKLVRSKYQYKATWRNARGRSGWTASPSSRALVETAAARVERQSSYRFHPECTQSTLVFSPNFEPESRTS